MLYVIKEKRGDDNKHKVLRLTEELKADNLEVLSDLIKELKSDDLPKRNHACKYGALHGKGMLLVAELIVLFRKKIRLELQHTVHTSGIVRV